MDPSPVNAQESESTEDFKQHCILFPTYATRHSRSGMARKLAGITRDNNLHDTLESRFSMFLANNTQGARFTIQCVGPTETSQMELAAEHNLHDQSVDVLRDETKTPDGVLAAEEVKKDKAQYRQSIEKGRFISESKHEQHEHNYPSEAVGHAVDKFIQPKPPPLPERLESSFADRWAKGTSLMKGAYQKYKPIVMAQVSNNGSNSSVDTHNSPPNAPQCQSASRSESPASNYPGDTSSPSPSIDAATIESGDTVMPQTETYYKDFGYGDLPTVDISSQPGGHFNGTLRVSHKDIQAYNKNNIINGGQQRGDHPRFLRLHARHPKMSDESRGTVDLIDPEGISIISDIDDTIKETNISAGTKIILRNTFLNEMQDVPGMAEVYTKWWKAGAALHYVSNSPWQLIPSLLEFFNSHKFPPGSAHLRLHDSVFKTYFMTPGEHKKASIHDILTDFPDRKFVLIGDSGEIDLEIYTQIAIDYPKQIIKIFIRDITTARLEELAKSNSTPTRSRSFTSHSPKTSYSPKTSMFAAATEYISRQIDSASGKIQTSNNTENNSPSSASTRSGYPFPRDSGDGKEDTLSPPSSTFEFDQDTMQVNQAKPTLDHQRSSSTSSSGSTPQATPGKIPALPPRSLSPAVTQSSSNRVSSFASSTTSSNSSTFLSMTVLTPATGIKCSTNGPAVDDEPMPGAPPPSEPTVVIKNPLETWTGRVEQCRKKLPEGMLTLFTDSSTLLNCPDVDKQIQQYRDSSVVDESNGKGRKEEQEQHASEVSSKNLDVEI
ncbi:hypothetical protein BGX27_009422 [Mortierella sp. AM989]|nr:hypothetical protein BGX27_009422 [Mortierella sp. AM989]